MIPAIFYFNVGSVHIFDGQSCVRVLEPYKHFSTEKNTRFNFILFEKNQKRPIFTTAKCIGYRGRSRTQ